MTQMQRQGRKCFVKSSNTVNELSNIYRHKERFLILNLKKARCFESGRENIYFLKQGGGGEGEGGLFI